MNRRRFLPGVATTFLFAISAANLPAQVFPEPPTWTYRLIEGSHLVDDCLVCGRPAIMVPMRGSFQLRFSSLYPFSAAGDLQDIAFEAGSAAGSHYKLTGKGTFFATWEMEARLNLTLEVNIYDGYTNKACWFTNDSPAVSRAWPMLQVQANQTNSTFLQQFTLQINAAPFREIWFATALNFTAGIWNSPTNRVSSGDLLSSEGRVVKRNQQLTARLGIQPLVPDLGLDDFDILPGGEIGFSIPEDVFSETLGPLNAGDLLSDQGRILRSNAELVSAFAPQPPATNGVGLRAVQVLDNGAVYFSVPTNFFSEKLGRKIQRGDLLSDRGEVVETGAQLVNRFGPIETNSDYGLDAVYVWPSGEVWFSLAEGFTGARGEVYGPGDLLSDQGYVVYRNLELMSSFQPLEDVSSFGLDGLYVVSDATAPNHLTSTTILSTPQLTNQPAASLVLQWSGSGRVYQLEKGTNLANPFFPANAITTDTFYVDPGVLTNQAMSLYRVRQWW